ncbi:MAG: amidohydrolase family protein [Eubacterium sp.]|nr:amidohydrolase family protein [Eubacterium sp.]
MLPGFTADFTVLDRDITALPVEALYEAKVLATIVDGKQIF